MEPVLLLLLCSALAAGAAAFGVLPSLLGQRVPMTGLGWANAIAVHNVPEGLAITTVLRPRGVSLLSCAGWSFISSVPQPLLAVPAFLFVDAFRPAMPYAMGFAAGAMVFMVLVELLPEAYQEGRRAEVGLVVSVTLVAMVVFQQTL